MFKLSIPNMMLLGGEALERQLGLDESSGWNPCEGMSVLTNLPPLSTHHEGKAHRDAAVCCIARRRRRLTLNAVCQHLDLGLSSLQN